MMSKRRKKNRTFSGTSDIAPEDIFLDSSNLPEFNRSQFEGRIERPISKFSLILLSSIFILVGAGFLYKLGVLQIKNGEAYAKLSEENRLQHSYLFADRGLIYDRNGVELAWNTPNETGDFARRSYTSLEGHSHLLGFVRYPAKDTHGFYYQEEYLGADGIELALNAELSGKNGLKIIETNAVGDFISHNTIRLPEEGESVQLTIDSRVQNQLYKIMFRLASERGFTGGAGGIMDVNTGELIAFVSFPEFSSEVLSNATNTALISSYQNDSQGTPFLNRMTDGLYTPGSIVKPFMALGALQEEVITPQKTIYSSGRLVVPNPYNPDLPSVFTDWKAHGSVDMQRAIAVSSNIYFYQIGGGFESQEGLGIERIEKYMRMFGFGRPVSFLSSESKAGVIPSPEWKAQVFNDDPWRLGDTYFTSIGQYGFQVTPIQGLRAISAIANKGTLLTPRLVKGEVTPENSKEIPIAENHFDVVSEGMRQGVLYGTVSGINVPYVSVAGKTGTAEIGSQKKLVNSWTIGFFPFEEPRYAFTILMERGPQSNLIGATAVARELFDWMREHTPEYFLLD
ncbi:MAG: penicillin-binding transpeptidase domain-containing protein [Candidatus Paceibacterota bacterium]